MNKESIFQLHKLADEYEAKAKAYRAVANDLMNGTGHEVKRKVGRPRKETAIHPLKNRKYNGTHWTQNPANKAKVIAMARLAGKAAAKAKRAR